MTVPVPLRLAAVALGATAFYTWVGQMVPQKEVLPPEVKEISRDVSPEQMAEIGREIFEGKGICATCHKIGGSGPQRFPDMEGVASRAGKRVPGLSQLEYFAQSLYEPEAFIVEGFSPGMPPVDKPPIGLTDDEILAVIAFLQSLGGEPTVTMETRHAYNGGGEDAAAEGAGDTAAGDEAAGDAPVEPALAILGCDNCHGEERSGAFTGRSYDELLEALGADALREATLEHSPISPTPSVDPEELARAIEELEGRR